MKALHVITSLLVASTLFGASNPTPNYWKCYNKVGGSWDYGRVPNACDVSPFGDSDYVKNTFLPIVFDDTNNREAEKKRYIDNMVPLIRDASTYYLALRNPSASSAEKKAWGDAVLAVAHQETFMTHYRIASDTRMKMIRGDYGHGHGMMQIDDRWHYAEINEGKGWQIFDNMTYALEIFYDGWSRAATASCVGGATNYYSRTRAAYSVYNGGASKVCRWTNPNDTWAKNDKNYKAKLDAKSWETWVDDLDAPSVLNAACFMEGNEQCGPVEITDSSLIKLPTSEYCIVVDKKLECVEEQIDALCLSRSFNTTLTTSVVSISSTQADEYTKTLHPRSLCEESVEKLVGVGASIKTAKAITIRDTPAGTSVGTSKLGSIYQVLDFEVRNDENEYRYYKIQEGTVVGYIYAGKKTDADTWTTKASHSELSNVIIPQAGDTVKIVSESGINQRETAGGTLIVAIPKGTLLHVIETVVQGENRKVYYKVTYNAKSGYIYGGQMMPERSLDSWAILSDESVSVPVATLKSDISWGYLRSCASDSCDKVANVVSVTMQTYCQTHSCTFTQEDLLLVERDNDWVKVTQKLSQKSGWIQENKLNWK